MGFISCRKEETPTLFTLMDPDDTGISFKNILKETPQFNVLEYGYLYNGGGISVGDLNNDGLPDIYFTGNMVGSRLYINQGNLEFTEIAEKAGVFAAGLWNTGTTMADVNADGYLDIYVCRSAASDPANRKNLLFINNGDLTFSEKGAAFGVDDAGYSTQGAFFDFDRDGDLDLYVLNHSTQEYAGFGQITPQLKNRKNEAYADKLYRNDGGQFIDVSNQAGLVSNVLGFGLGIAISDINNDGWPDIYVSNDYNEQDYLYINNKNGTFTENLEAYIGHTSLFSMGSDIGDINNDGYTDIMTLDMLPEDNYRQKMVSGPDNYDKYSLLVKSGFYNQSMRNMLQLNNKGESFSEIGQFAGISNTDWSWSSLFADLDNDGYKDLYITNGYKRDYTNMDFMNYAVQEKLKETKTGQRTAIMELLEKIPATVVENYAYHNNGDLSFTKVNQQWGLNQESLSNGAAYGDLDNDGDLDLVVNNIEEEAFVYRNNSEKLSGNNYIRIQLVGEGGNTFGIGSRVEVELDSGKVLLQEQMPTRGYQSSVDYTMVFGLGEVQAVKTVKVTWPTGTEALLHNVKANQSLVLYQRDSKGIPEEAVTAGIPYFKEVTADSILPYTHIENNYNDFKREQLLPHKLSTQGPRMAIADVDGDGLEDLFIGGASGQAGEVWLQENTGKFRRSGSQAFKQDAGSEDIGALFFDADGDNDMDLYVVSGGNDFDTGSELLQDRLYFNNGSGSFNRREGAVPKMPGSSSCVAASDFDRDGDEDLFVGGRLVPGRYPSSPPSYILENDGKGNFTDTGSSVISGLAGLGMVTDAIWTDINGDELPDLIAVGEWMGIQVFKNDGKTLTNISEESGTAETQGWWNSIEQGDFDGDGDMDYVLGNFGLNSQLKASAREPVTLYVKDFDANGSLDPILCSYVMGESYPVFSKDDLLGQLSMLKSRYVNYSDYAGQKLTDIFTESELQGARVLKAVDFASTYMENKGDTTFTLSPLPAVAQFAPVYGILPGDFNNDGRLDILMGGNFYGSRVKYGRYDANRGVLLLGDGTGGFRASDPSQSGLDIDGEVRDIIGFTDALGRRICIFALNNTIARIYKIQEQERIDHEAH